MSAPRETDSNARFVQFANYLSIFFRAYQQSLTVVQRGDSERTEKKLDATYRSLDLLRAKLVENPYELDVYFISTGRRRKGKAIRLTSKQLSS